MKNRALKRTLQDFKRHPWLHGVSVATIVVSLVILGGFLLCYRNIEILAKKTNPSIMGTVYLEENTPAENVQALRTKILGIQNVLKVVYKEKQSVMADLEAFLGQAGGDILPGSDLFPDVFEVELNTDSGRADLLAVTKIIREFPEVSEVDFSEDWLSHYKDIRSFLNVFGIILMITILVGCSFITANFMGIRHQNRRREIDIIRLIGASRDFVLKPFLWEGIIEGMIAAVMAILILFFGKLLISSLFTINLDTLIGSEEWLFLSFTQAMVVIALGVTMACLGSIAVFFRFNEKQT